MSRVIIAGSGSHCGKTTLTCGLLEVLRHRGVDVSAYKTGPDYIDPQFLRRAGKCEVYNLDTWLMTSQQVKQLFTHTSHGTAIIEGAMGLYDGGIHSTASIAKILHAPVILVIDAKSLGESAAAIALGFREYDHDVNLAGVILNRAGSDYHVKIIADELSRVGIKCLGAMRRNDELIIPERHLGLACEGRYDAEKLRLAVEAGIDIDEIMRISGSVCELRADYPEIRPSAERVRVGAARDEGFTFYYPESLGVLEAMGAEIVYFSPIHDKCLPDADGYIFGGGFPEMYAGELAANASMLASVRQNVRPVLAECGGYMYLCRSLKDLEGRVHEMAGIIPCDAVMTKRAVLGYMEARALRRNIICDEGAAIRGHEFHYSRIEPEGHCAFTLTRRGTDTQYFGGYAHENILASYLHMNFFGNPALAERFILSCKTLRTHSNQTQH